MRLDTTLSGCVWIRACVCLLVGLCCCACNRKHLPAFSCCSYHVSRLSDPLLALHPHLCRRQGPAERAHALAEPACASHASVGGDAGHRPVLLPHASAGHGRGALFRPAHQRDGVVSSRCSAAAASLPQCPREGLPAGRRLRSRPGAGETAWHGRGAAFSQRWDSERKWRLSGSSHERRTGVGGGSCRGAHALASCVQACLRWDHPDF